MKAPPRRHPAAFTLIELMAVITIIVILAGLVVGGMGYVNEKQAREKAKVQIALLSKAIEEYKLDNGNYPTPAGTSATDVKHKNGTGNTYLLYKLLYLDGAATNPPGKIYLPELDPINNKQGWITGSGTSITIVDPWGQPYRYRVAVLSNGTKNPSAQNPDFDLWSIGKDGLTKTGNSAADFSHKDVQDDIRNF
ncbi:MAG: type II secretion system protein GspG [Luteolibacter sp.]|nr:type II secretion system protein GspG [Luteolibacter sp.]